MTEGHLARLTAHRRTWRLIDGWKAPEGFDVIVLSRRPEMQVDVVLMHQGKSVRALNLKFLDAEECGACLDFLKDTLLAEVSAAYDRHEAPGMGDAILDMTLAQAARRFREGLESALCRGKGGEE